MCDLTAVAHMNQLELSEEYMGSWQSKKSSNALSWDSTLIRRVEPRVQKIILVVDVA
jgi:hypothetical protein